MRKNQIIRIAAVQLDFKLSTDTFPPELIEKEKIRIKVINAIRIAKKKGMIIAEFDLDNKSPQLQTTINPDEEIIPVRNIRMIAL